MDLNLFLKSTSPNSDYYVIQNKNGQYLRGKKLFNIKNL